MKKPQEKSIHWLSVAKLSPFLFNLLGKYKNWNFDFWYYTIITKIGYPKTADMVFVLNSCGSCGTFVTFINFSCLRRVVVCN